MRTYTSRFDTLKYSLLAMLMAAGIAVDLMLFGQGIIVSMVTVLVPMAACGAGLVHSMMHLGIMDYGADNSVQRPQSRGARKTASQQRRARERQRAYANRNNSAYGYNIEKTIGRAHAYGYRSDENTSAYVPTRRMAA